MALSAAVSLIRLEHHLCYTLTTLQRLTAPPLQKNLQIAGAILVSLPACCFRAVAAALKHIIAQAVACK